MRIALVISQCNACALHNFVNIPYGLYWYLLSCLCHWQMEVSSLHSMEHCCSVVRSWLACLIHVFLPSIAHQYTLEKAEIGSQVSVLTIQLPIVLLSLLFL